MSRRGYVSLTGKWPPGFVPTPKILRDLDQHSSELVNGEDGGSWSPESPIVLGSGIMPALKLSTAGSAWTGDVETVAGNSSSEVGGGLQLLGTTVPSFQTARTRVIIVGLQTWTELIGSSITESFRSFSIDTALFGPNSVGNSQSSIVHVPLALREAHNGANITQARVYYRVGKYHATLPASANKISCRLVRMTASTTQQMHTNALGYDANGWVYDTETNADLYFNGSKARYLDYIPDQFQTVDPATYAYALQIRDSGPSGLSNNVFLSAEIYLGAIADMRPE